MIAKAEHHLGLTTLTAIVVAVALFLAVGATVLGVVAITGVSSDVSTQAQHREHSVLENCEGQNERNHNTIALIDQKIAELPPAAKHKAEASRGFTVLLINALAPERNCADVLHKAGF